MARASPALKTALNATILATAPATRESAPLAMPESVLLLAQYARLAAIPAVQSTSAPASHAQLVLFKWLAGSAKSVLPRALPAKALLPAPAVAKDIDW
jgi:hypothetical protein